MRRAFFTFVAGVSMVLFVATLVLWVRGRRTMDHFWLVHRDEGSELIRSAGGRITVRHNRPNARERITFPRRVSHWSCAVGSQLPPAWSRLHWAWRFLTYEGLPPPTPAERRAAYAAIENAKAVRASMGIGEEWAEARYRYGNRVPSTPMPALTQLQQMQLYTAESAARMARSVLEGSSYWEWTFPAWLAAAVTALPPALWFALWRRRRRILREGRCPDCGYDLRASPERCPECGRDEVARARRRKARAHLTVLPPPRPDAAAQRSPGYKAPIPKP